ASQPLQPGYTFAQFSPTDDSVVYTQESDATVHRWLPPAGQAQTIAHVGTGDDRVVARFDRSGTRIAYERADEASLTVQDLRSGRVTHLGQAPKNVYDAQFSPDGKYVAAATQSGILYVWRLDRPAAPFEKLSGHRSHINTIDYSPDGR